MHYNAQKLIKEKAIAGKAKHTPSQDPCVHNAYNTGEKRQQYKQNTLEPITQQRPNTVLQNIFKVIYFM